LAPSRGHQLNFDVPKDVIIAYYKLQAISVYVRWQQKSSVRRVEVDALIKHTFAALQDWLADSPNILPTGLGSRACVPLKKKIDG